MSDVDRLSSELELAKLCEVLEDARDAMHADRSDAKAMAAYNAASDAVASARSTHRENYRVSVGPGDAAPEVDTVNSKAGVHR
jgi:hypothetical protein